MSDETKQDGQEAINGLRYIADSPSHGNGGFHPNTVDIANKALDAIAAKDAEIAALTAERDRLREALEDSACSYCHGAGWLDSYQTKCPRCNGHGEMVCTRCWAYIGGVNVHQCNTESETTE